MGDKGFVLNQKHGFGWYDLVYSINKLLLYIYSFSFPVETYDIEACDMLNMPQASPRNFEVIIRDEEPKPPVCSPKWYRSPYLGLQPCLR